MEFNIMFSDTFNPFVSLNVRYEVPQTYKRLFWYTLMAAFFIGDVNITES
jgi:hypothetical protein